MKANAITLGSNVNWRQGLLWPISWSHWRLSAAS